MAWPKAEGHDTSWKHRKRSGDVCWFWRWRGARKLIFRARKSAAYTASCGRQLAASIRELLDEQGLELSPPRMCFSCPVWRQASEVAILSGSRSNVRLGCHPMAAGLCTFSSSNVPTPYTEVCRLRDQDETSRLRKCTRSLPQLKPHQALCHESGSLNSNMVFSLKGLP